MSNTTQSPDELAENIEAIRERLGATIDQLVHRAKPSTIMNRQLAKTKAHFVTPDGSPRTENIVPIVLYSALAIAGAVVIRKILK